MILHTVNRSPFTSFALKDCLTQFAEHDLLLLINDAVIAACAQTEQHADLLKLDKSKRLFILQVDLQARGLEPLLGQPISYTEFVELTIQCKSQLSW